MKRQMRETVENISAPNTKRNKVGHDFNWNLTLFSWAHHKEFQRMRIDLNGVHSCWDVKARLADSLSDFWSFLVKFHGFLPTFERYIRVDTVLPPLLSIGSYGTTKNPTRIFQKQYCAIGLITSECHASSFQGLSSSDLLESRYASLI